MAPITNARVLYEKIPTAPQDYERCVTYDNSQTVDLDTVPLNGSFLLKTLALSMDPFLRLNIRDPSIPGPYRVFTLGEPIFSFGIGIIVRSEFDGVTPGDYVYIEEMPFQEYSVLSGSDIARVIKNEAGVAPEVYTGPVGLAGQTAYYGWKEYALPRKGDTVFVSSGGGAVGSFIIQMAKAEGLKVIASAGTEDKIAFAKECGADVVFNYKTENAAEILQREGPIDIYWDNVSGETLDAALGAAATGARFIACGASSAFSSPEPKMKNLVNLVTRQVKLSGYIVTTLHDKYADEFYDVVPKMIAAGKLKYNLDVKTLAESGRGLSEVCSGNNKGKITIVL